MYSDPSTDIMKTAITLASCAFLMLSTQANVLSQDLKPDFTVSKQELRHDRIYETSVDDGGLRYAVQIRMLETEDAPDDLWIMSILFIATESGETQATARLGQSALYTDVQIGVPPSLRFYGQAAVFFHADRGILVVPMDSIWKSQGRPSRAELDDFVGRVARAYGFGHSWSTIPAYRPEESTDEMNSRRHDK